MAALGYRADFQGVRDYVAAIRRTLGTKWGYVAFFTKYPVNHFAYALKPRLVMHYGNDGWGPDNIDRVFAHETGHVFGCPDEYASSGCNCLLPAGHLREVNGNCESCAQPFVPCLMAANTWAMCQYTPVHLGWRDTDGDGVLDPVDTVGTTAFDWSALCAALPWLCSLLGLGGAAPTGVAGPMSTGVTSMAPQVPPRPEGETISLELLRTVLDDAEMERVREALERREQESLLALETKLRNAADALAERRGERRRRR
jgi:hypothetical protein